MTTAKDRHSAKLILSAILAALLPLAAFVLLHQQEVRWEMIDVNKNAQGDAHLITGNKNVTLIDTGLQSTAEKYLIPKLINQNIRRINTLIITHPHQDHYGGLIHLLDETSISIDRIYMTNPSKEWAKREHWGVKLSDLELIQAKAQSRNIPIFPVQEFESIEIGSNYHLTKIAAPTESELSALGIKPDINDLSLIAVLSNGRVRVLFTGDLNRAFSTHLLSTLSHEELRADILKFPHHAMEGFATDEFIRATQAKIFMNPMPAKYLKNPRHERAIKIAAEMNAKVYSNGQNGNVVVSLRKSTYRVETER